MEIRVQIFVFVLISLGVTSVISFKKEELMSRLPAYQVYYKWKKADYVFKSSSMRSKMIKSKEFIAKNVLIAGIKIYKNRMFLTTPRYKSGIPATINEVPYNCNYYAPFKKGSKMSPKLKPFPSWAMQKMSDCSAFQFVQGMELDQYGRLWVVDGGRTAVLEKNPVNRCTPKLVIFDLKKKDKIIFRYEFPNNVASPTTNLMKDINVACTSRKNCFAYIVDIADNKLVIFDYKNKKSWSVQHSSMAPFPERVNLTINGKPTSVPFGIAGSVLSPKNKNYDTFYYSPIASTSVFSIATSVLKNPPENRKLKNKQVNELGLRSGQSDGWAMDNKGTLYFGNLPQSAVYKTKIMAGQTRLGLQERIAQSNRDISFPDLFSFDNYGNLALTTTKFQLYAISALNFKEYNFRVLRFLIKTSGYNTNRPRVCRRKNCSNCGS